MSGSCSSMRSSASWPLIGGDDLEIFGRQLGFEQLHVREDIVDDQDAGGHGVHPMNLRTVSRKLVTEIGLEI